MKQALNNIKYNHITVNIINNYYKARNSGVEAFIFVATTGRSGSKTLSAIFESSENAVCFHEPYPVMLPAELIENSFEEMFLRRKRINIRRAAVGYKYYFETNHQFIKRFAEEAIREFKEKIRIIHLYRNPIDVAKSFFEINSIPGITKNGINYLLDPFGKDTKLDYSKILEMGGLTDEPFLRCLWYWYEIEARVFSLKIKYPWVIIADIRTEDLNNEKILNEKFKKLKLTESFNFSDKAGLRLNRKTGLKINQIDRDEAVQKNKLFMASLASTVSPEFLNYLKLILAQDFNN